MVINHSNDKWLNKLIFEAEPGKYNYAASLMTQIINVKTLKNSCDGSYVFRFAMSG